MPKFTEKCARTFTPPQMITASEDRRPDDPPLPRVPGPRGPVDRTVWSVRELQDVYARTGGTVTARQATRTASDGTAFTVIELALTTNQPDTATVTTDWDPADEPHGWALPVVQAVARPAGHQGDSDPDADELLRRAREQRKTRALAGAL